MKDNFPCTCGHALALHCGRYDGQENWYPTACDVEECVECPAFTPDNLKYLEQLSVL